MGIKKTIYIYFILINLSLFYAVITSCGTIKPDYTHDLPVIRIDTVNSEPILDRENWVTMTFSLTDPSNPSNNIPAISNQQIRGRGNASWTQTPEDGKRPYRIRFRNDQQQSLFGLAAARNWVLLKSGNDLNNSFGFELGKRLGLEYTCSYNHVHLYLNGDYRGLYLLTEHRQADPAVIGAAGRPKVDLTEGWFVEIDRYFDESPKFRTAHYNLPIMVKTPEDSNVNENDWDFDISKFPVFNRVVSDWNNITNLMASDAFPENGYRYYVDIDSFVKYFIVQTLVKNNDLFRPGVDEGREIGSTFFYKDKGGKIGAGPIWDLDWSFAPWEFEGEKFLPTTAPYQIHPWFKRFHDDPVFHVRYKEIWNNNYQNNILTMSKFIDSHGAKIKKGARENQKRWLEGDIYWHLNHIKSYFNTRVSYLNREYNKVDVLPASGKFHSLTPQKFTLVAFGDITNITSSLQKGRNSPFEIINELSITPAGDGGYLAVITVRPKSAGTDKLIIKGKNQGKEFTLSVNLTY